MQTTPRIFDVEVIHDDEAGVWVGICDALPATGEGETFDAMIRRFEEVAADMAVENGHASDGRVALRYLVTREVAA